MRKIILLAGAALLFQPLSVFAQGQGNNHGNNQDRGKSAQAERGSDASGNRGNSGENRVGGNGAAGSQGNENRRSDRAEPGNNGRSAQSAAERPGNGQSQRANVERAGRDVARGASPVQAARNSDRGVRRVEAGRYSWRDLGFQGCPPGLARKDNGCLPPGQARRLSSVNDRELRWYRYLDWYRTGSSNDWRYGNGYAYRVDPRTNLISSALPLLGGALFGGSSWPANYAANQLTPYQINYFGHDRDYDYRSADGAIFAVDPQDQMIQSIVGLITGDDWSVGSQMPAGYGAYNVPSQYRQNYTDNSSSLYRYNDGYVYEVDPTTQIVRSLIELVV